MSKKHRGRYQGDPVTYQLPSPAGGVQLETFVPWTLVKRGLRKQIITPLDAPQDAPLGAPYLPSLPFSGDQIHVGYDYRWNENGDDVVNDTTYFDTIFGGYAGTKTWPGSVNANASCGGTTVTHYFGGRANSIYTPSLRYQIDICP